MTNSSNSRYNILNFIDNIKGEDPDRYKQLKDQTILVYISRSRNPNYSDDIKSSYTALWDGIRVCGQTSLELNELEYQIEQDRSRLAEEGISSFIKGGSRRIHSIRRT